VPSRQNSTYEAVERFCFLSLGSPFAGLFYNLRTREYSMRTSGKIMHCPRIVFVDDLANKWIDLNGDGKYS
jgi:hypothetical protein